MARLSRLFLFTLIVITASAAQAQLRKPTPAEQKALDHYAAVMNKVLDQFQSDDWDEHVDYTIDDDVSVAPNAGTPLDVNELMQRSYNVRRGSARFNTKIMPLMQKLMQESDVSAKAKLGHQVQGLMHVRVDVHFNRTNIGDIAPPPPGNHGLQIPGAAFAYKINNDVPDPGTSAYLLAFGNWHPLKWDAEQGWYHFVFAHPQNTPFIENIEIRIHGADDRVQELLHAIDWNEVNQALTR